MKGYKSVGVTVHKQPNSKRDMDRNHRFRQKNRANSLAMTQGRGKNRCSAPILQESNEVQA